jgi:hypothetical protein
MCKEHVWKPCTSVWIARVLSCFPEVQSFVVVHVDGARLCLWTAATNGHIVHPPDDIWVWRTTVEMILTCEYRRTRGKPLPVPLCPPQSPHILPGARTRASAVIRRRLTAWAMTRLKYSLLCFLFIHQGVHNIILDTSGVVTYNARAAWIVTHCVSLLQYGGP